MGLVVILASATFHYERVTTACTVYFTILGQDCGNSSRHPGVQ